MLFNLLIIIVAWRFFYTYNDQPKYYNPPNYEAIMHNIEKQTISYEKLEINFSGPESFAFTSSYIYTGSNDGRIFQIPLTFFKSEPTLFMRIHDQSPEMCDNIGWRIRKCGRPLGMRARKNQLFVLDSVLGFFQIDLKSKTKRKLFEHFVKNETESFFNSFVFDPHDDNLIYFSVSSTKYNVDKTPLSLLKHENTGKLFAFSLLTRKFTELAASLFFPNGMEISYDEKWLFVSETSLNRINRLSLDQVREFVYSSGKANLNLELFGSILPGEPDNLVSYRNKLLVSFALCRSDGSKIVSDYLANFPFVRQLLIDLTQFVGFIFENLRNLFSCISYLHEDTFAYSFIKPICSAFENWFEKIEFKFKSGYIFYDYMPSKGGFAILNQDTGKIEKVIQISNEKFISEVTVIPFSNQFLFGSFINNHIGYIDELQL